MRDVVRVVFEFGVRGAGGAAGVAGLDSVGERENEGCSGVVFFCGVWVEGWAGWVVGSWDWDWGARFIVLVLERWG